MTAGTCSGCGQGHTGTRSGGQVGVRGSSTRRPWPPESQFELSAMERFLKHIEDREATRGSGRGRLVVVGGLPSVLEGGGGSQVLLPVGSHGAMLPPVTQSTLPSVLAAGQGGGLQMQGGNIEVVKHIFNVHSKGEVKARGGEWYKCFPDHGESHDKKEYMNFESTWTFKAEPPKKSGVDFWVKQRLFRVVILYCPKDEESVRVETLINEVFRLKGNQTDPKDPDRHTDPRLYARDCDGTTTWCQMSCYELGILSLKESAETTYQLDHSYTEETESYSSYDKGKTFRGREGHGEPRTAPPGGLANVPDYLGYYIADYFIEHCPPPPVRGTMTPVTPDPPPPDTGGGTPTPPDRGRGTSTPRGVVLPVGQTPSLASTSEPGARESVTHGQTAARLTSSLD